MRRWAVASWPYAAWLACILMIGVAIVQVQGIASRDTLRGCELRNSQIRELNDRTEAINVIVDTLRADPDTDPRQYRTLFRSYSAPVVLTDCQSLFAPPWPF